MIKKYLKRFAPLWLLEEPGSIYSWDKKELRKLKNKWKGKRCFVIGNGPSLNEVDLSYLEREFSFGVNGVFYMTDKFPNFKPTFYVVEDGAVMSDNVDRINNYNCHYKFLPNIYRKLIYNKSNVNFFNMNRGFYERGSDYFEIPRFTMNPCHRIFCGQSVTFINLQLAYYFGFKEVYLIGMDFKYDIPKSAEIKGDTILSKENDPNHFHPEYFGAGKTWHDPKIHNVLKSYELAKLIYEQSGRKIYNATVGGDLSLFERKNYQYLFS